MSHVRRLVPTGGLDVAEDVLGGLQEVDKLNWDKSNNKKVLVHFADAPCHGCDYHTLEPKDDRLHDMATCRAQYGRKDLRTVIEVLAIRRARLHGTHSTMSMTACTLYRCGLTSMSKSTC